MIQAGGTNHGPFYNAPGPPCKMKLIRSSQTKKRVCSGHPKIAKLFKNSGSLLTTDLASNNIGQ
jgi:hypothetical protein